MNEVTYLPPILGILLAVASALLSMIETSFSALTEAMRQVVRRKNRGLGEKLEELMRSRREVLTAIQIADNLVTLPLIFVCLWWTDTQILDPYLPRWLAATFLFSAVILLCELLPKLIGLAQPINLISICWPLLSSLHRVLRPMVRLMLTWHDRWVSRLSGQEVLPAESLSLEEMQSLLELAKEEGGLRRDEAAVLRKIIKLSFETANHCMVPRVDTFILPDNLSNSDAASLLRKARHRRVPVRGETPDEILGILDVQEFLLAPGGHYTEMLKPPSFVPETMPLLNLLIAFQTHRQSTALLLDEYGGLEGLVTQVDILEDVLGEEGAKTTLAIEKVKSGKVLASGSAHLDDLGEVLGIDTSSFSPRTIGGLLIEHFGQLPKPGASMLLKNWEVKVRRVSRKRVLEVLISPLSPNPVSPDQLFSLQ